MKTKDNLLMFGIALMLLTAMFSSLTIASGVGNPPPDGAIDAVISAPKEGDVFKVGDVIHFSANGSYSQMGYIMAVVWEFGDGGVINGSEFDVTHTYGSPGTYKVSLHVVDSAGYTDSEVVNITVVDPDQQGMLSVWAEPPEVFIDPSDISAASTTIYVDVGSITYQGYVSLTATVTKQSGTGNLEVDISPTSGIPPFASIMNISFVGKSGDAGDFKVFVRAEADNNTLGSTEVYVHVGNATSIPQLKLDLPGEVTLHYGEKVDVMAHLTNMGSAPFSGEWQVVLENISDPDNVPLDIYFNTVEITELAGGQSTSVILTIRALQIDGPMENVTFVADVTVVNSTGIKVVTSPVKINIVPPENMPPKVELRLPEKAYVNQPVTFFANATDPDGNPLNYTWIIGMGDTVTYTGMANLTLTFDRPGVVNVTLIVSDGIVNVTVKGEVEIIELPAEIPQIEVVSPEDMSVFMVGQNIEFVVEFIGGSYPIDIAMDFGDGTVKYMTLAVEGVVKVNHIYEKAGAYTFTVIVHLGNSDIKESIHIDVRMPDEEATLIISEPADGSTFEIGEMVHFAAFIMLENGSRMTDIPAEWWLGGELLGKGNPYDRSFSEPGTYPIKCLVTYKGNQLSAIVSINIVPVDSSPLKVVITSPRDGDSFPVGHEINFSAIVLDSEGDQVYSTLVWEFGDGSNAEGQEVTHAYTNQGVYDVMVTTTALMKVEDDNGTRSDSAEASTTNMSVATASANAHIRVVIYDDSEGGTAISIMEPLPGDVFAVNRSIKFVAEAFAKDGTKLGVMWDFGDGTTGSGHTVEHTYEFTGEYKVTAKPLTPNGSTPLPGSDSVIIKVITPANGDTVDQTGRINLTDMPGINHPPVAVANFEKKGDTYIFDASGSFDTDGDNLRFFWDFGDGITGRGVVAKHQYSSEGVYVVELRVVDEHGLASVLALIVKVSSAPAYGDISNATAFMKKLGASMDIYGDNTSANIYHSGMKLRVRNMSRDRLEFHVEASFHEGKLIVINIGSNASFNISDVNDIVVKVNNTPIRLATVTEVLEGNSSEYIYCITIGTMGIQLLVYFPHFSQYVLTVEKAGEETDKEGDTGDGSSQIQQPNIAIPLVVGIILVVIIVAVFGFLSKKGDRYYNDYYTDERRHRGNEDEEEVDWEEMEVDLEEEKKKD